MSERLGQLTGELMAALHTALTRAGGTDLEGPLVRFGRYLCAMGAPRESVEQLVARLVEQAAAHGDSREDADRRALDELRANAVTRCLAAFDLGTG